MSSELILDALIAPTAVAGLTCLVAVAARRAPAALRNTLWRIALVGFWAAPLIVIATHAAPWQPHTIAVPLLPPPREAAPAMPPGSDLTPTPASISPTSTVPDQPTPPERLLSTPHIRPPTLLLLLWAAGAALGIIYLIRDLRAVRPLILASHPLASPSFQHRLAALAAELGLRSSPAVAASPVITTPTVAGLNASVLLLPEDFSSAPGSYDAVIVHELAHIRRRDLTFMLAARLTRAFWWWHPLAWLISRELVLSAEEACDDWAVALTGRREDYATTLVDWADAAMPVPGLTCAPRGRALVRRVQRILQSTQAPRLHLSWQAHTILALSAMAAMVLVGTVHVRAIPADETVTHPILLAQAGEEAAQPQTGHTVTVQGKVLGPDGQPLAEVEVLVQYNRPDWETVIQKARTQADGSFTFTCNVVNLTCRMYVAAQQPTLAVDWAPFLPGDEDITLRLASDGLPVPVRNTLGQLMTSFHGISGSMNAFGMQKDVEKHRAQIDTILTYSNSSDRNADTLGDYLCASLAEYAERFKPGTEIDAQTLSTRSYIWETSPEYGVTIQAYLLLELARQRRSPTLTRRALSTLYDVVLARSYLGEKSFLHRHPERAHEIARVKRENGGYRTTLGAEIAWCCEQFMVETSQVDEPGIPEPGMVVIADYCRWRKDTVTVMGTRLRWLLRTQQHRTMAYVKKLVAALPPDQ